MLQGADFSTLNSNDEAVNILTKAAGALLLDTTPEWVEKKIDELFEMDTEQNPMDFEAFWAWFVKSCEEGSPQGVTRDV